MSKNYTYKLNDLTVGETFLVRGKACFSRIARQTTDAEREKSNAERKAKNRNAIDIQRNYTSMTICNASVLCKNPSQATPEEIYASESCYTSSNPEKYPGYNFTCMNKSKNLPKVGVLNPNKPDSYDEVTLDGKELAAGLDVTCVCRVFEGKNGNKGISLDTVLVNEPIRYYEGRTVDNSLKDFGIVFESAKPASAPETNIAGEDEAASVPQVRNVQPTAQSDMSNAAMNPNPVMNPAPQQASPFSSYGAQAGGPLSGQPAGNVGGPLGAGNRTY